MSEEVKAPEAPVAPVETVTTNPLKLDWPQDVGGITTNLQREGARAIGRIMGDDAKLDLVLDVLRVLAKHAKARCAEQKQEKVEVLKAAMARKAEKFRVTERGQRMELAAIKRQKAKLSEREAVVEQNLDKITAPVAPVAPEAPKVS